jgi:hypothetical protein
MERTEKPTTDFHRSKSVRSRMKRNIICYHATIPIPYLNALTDYELLNWTHPSERLIFAQKLNIPLPQPVILENLE